LGGGDQALAIDARMTVGLEQQLTRIERKGGDGEIAFADGRRLRVTSLDKVIFPQDGVTKGGLMRYYARVAPVLLPILADRPLGLKRYPDGIAGESFFQQNATKYPPGVRVERVKTEAGKAMPRFVGGDLPTLLYLVQIGTIALHTWQSRVGSLDHADYATIDLDPGKGVRFPRVVELARMLGQTIRARGLVAALKTSGSRGIHIAIPLPPRTSFASSTRLAEGIARELVEARSELATLERSIEDRPRGTIYVDVQQNARGKSVVSAYSARARNGAPVSAPLRWTELTGTLKLERFTVQTVPRRLARVGDLWGDTLLVGNRDAAMAKGS
jgi:bifunctional non-homologous end joining protein LigD